VKHIKYYIIITGMNQLSLEEFNIQTATFIRNNREKLGYSQRKLSTLAEVGNAVICKYEGSEGFDYNPTMKTLLKILQVLNKDIFQLSAFIKTYKND